jgi:hypothetical protein
MAGKLAKIAETKIPPVTRIHGIHQPDSAISVGVKTAVRTSQTTSAVQRGHVSARSLIILRRNAACIL